MSKIVLCVDDSATMQQVADITFRGTEFTYVGARSYDEGLEKAKSQKPAIVLADAQLGSGKSGYDLCLALKQHDATANVPVVILVGNSAPYDQDKGTQVGADANLPKPWDTQAMLEKINEIVGKAASGVARPGGEKAASAAPPIAAAAAASAPVAAAAPKTTPAAPPRSPTVIGMPTVTPKLPATSGNSGPARSNVVSVPPVGSNGGLAAPAAAAAARAPAPVISIASRAPMVSGSPSKRSQIVERTLAKMAARLAEAAGLEPGSPELAALLKLSAEVVERVVWEVVPDLAEQIIRENLHELAARRS